MCLAEKPWIVLGYAILFLSIISCPFIFFRLRALICAATLLNESPEGCRITPAQRSFDWLSLTVSENVCLDGRSTAEGTLADRPRTARPHMQMNTRSYRHLHINLKP